jgi:hypothetical protein
MEYTLCAWIDSDKLNMKYLIYNDHPKTLELLKKNIAKIPWNKLSSWYQTPNYTPILVSLLTYVFEQNQSHLVSWDDIEWYYLFELPNSESIPFTMDVLNKIDWEEVCKCSSNIRCLEKYIEYIQWKDILHNTHASFLFFKHVPKHMWQNILKKCKKEEDWSEICRNSVFPSEIYTQYLSKMNWYNISLYYSDVLFLEKHLSKLVWSALSLNPHAISILEKHVDKIDWECLSMNKKAISILEQYPEKVYWNIVSSHTYGIPLMKKHIQYINWTTFSVAISCTEKKMEEMTEFFLEHIHDVKWNEIDWKIFSKNPYLVYILEEHLDRVDWSSLSANPNAIHLLEKHLDKVDWSMLSMNPNGIHLLEKYMNEKKDMMNWYSICIHSKAECIWEKNMDKIYWEWLSENPNAMKFMERHKKEIDMSKICWKRISQHPTIFMD